MSAFSSELAHKHNTTRDTQRVESTTRLSRLCCVFHSDLLCLSQQPLQSRMVNLKRKLRQPVSSAARPVPQSMAAHAHCCLFYPAHHARADTTHSSPPAVRHSHPARHSAGRARQCCTEREPGTERTGYAASSDGGGGGSSGSEQTHTSGQAGRQAFGRLADVACINSTGLLDVLRPNLRKLSSQFYIFDYQYSYIRTKY